MIFITQNVQLEDGEVEMTAIRAQGSGGQNVNKVSSAIHLRFDIRASSLPLWVQHKLLALSDQRVSKDGHVIIKAQQHRTQDKNREAALARLVELIQSVMVQQKKRIPTRMSRSAKKKRVDNKTRRGKIKALRGKPLDH